MPGKHYDKETKGTALALLAAKLSPEQAAPIASVPVRTIRRWQHDPTLVDDSVTRGYMSAKMRELAVACQELAEDAAVALSELILTRRAGEAKSMAVTLGVLIDKAAPLLQGIEATKNITPGESDEDKQTIRALLAEVRQAKVSQDMTDISHD